MAVASSPPEATSAPSPSRPRWATIARDGFAFAAEADRGGAAAILSDRPRPDGLAAAWIRVFDPREALALCAANFYGQPSHKMRLVGITGTKGIYGAGLTTPWGVFNPIP